MIIRLLSAYIISTIFSAVFHCPKKELLISGFIGGISWLIYELTLKKFSSPIIPIFLSTLFITIISRHFSKKRNIPVNIYMLGGIILYVPGAGIYYTMYNVFLGNNTEALSKGIETLKISTSIAITIMIVLSIPDKTFNLKSILKLKSKNNK